MAGELVVSKLQDYAVVSNASQVAELMKDNIGNQGITQYQLDRIKVPAGGGLAWEIPGLGEEPEVTNEIRGVIVHWSDKRIRWARAFAETSEGEKPLCVSEDGDVGVGEPGGHCSQCPLGNFGADGSKPLCHLRRVLFLLRKTDFMPVVIDIPTTSVRIVRDTFRRLASKGISFYAVEVSLKLERQNNPQGISYSTIKIGVLNVLSPETMEIVKKYRQNVASVAKTVSVVEE